jgi:hypothetical protein
MEYDRVLIEQSIAKQYGVLPSKQGNLKYSDWAKMVSGLMDDTPLGRVVGVRSETDKDIIKNYTPEQRAVRDEWSRFLASRVVAKQFSEADWNKQMAEIERSFAAAFGQKRR